MKIFLGGRGAGKTYQLVQLVKADPTGVYVAPTWEQARGVARDYGLQQGQVCSISSLDRLRGRFQFQNLYIDQFVLGSGPLGFNVAAVAIEGENAMGTWTPMHDRAGLAERLNASVDLHNRFTYHRPVEGQPAKYEEIRAKALSLAALIEKLCPPSKERTEAINKVDEAVMWANASIARNT